MSIHCSREKKEKNEQVFATAVAHRRMSKAVEYVAEAAVDVPEVSVAREMKCRDGRQS